MSSANESGEVVVCTLTPLESGVDTIHQCGEWTAETTSHPQGQTDRDTPPFTHDESECDVLADSTSMQINRLKILPNEHFQIVVWALCNKMASPLQSSNSQ